MSEEPDTEEPEQYESRVGASYMLSRLLDDTSARISLVLISLILAMALFPFVDAELLDYRLAEAYLYHPLNAGSGARPLLPPVGRSN